MSTSTDLKFVELTPDVLKIYTYIVHVVYLNGDSVSIGNRGFVSHRVFIIFGVGVADFNSRMLY